LATHEKKERRLVPVIDWCFISLMRFEIHHVQVDSKVRCFVESFDTKVE
jgi:hypothetical protein